MTSKGKSCLIGCAGLLILGLIVALVGGAIGVSWVMDTGPEIENDLLTGSADGLTDTTPAEIERGLAGAESNEPLGITIDFEEGMYAVRAAREGEGFSLGGFFDPSRHRAEFKTVGVAGRPERVLVRVEPAPGNITSDPQPVLLTLPTDRSLDLHLRMRRGEATLDLTGLSVARLSVDASMANTIVSMSEPNAVPMSRLAIRGSMGNMELRGLAFAGPREIDFAGRMGNFYFDLDGPLATDVVSRMSVKLGNVELELPERSTHSFTRRSARFGNIESLRGPSHVEGDLELDSLPPHLELDLAATFANIEVR